MQTHASKILALAAVAVALVLTACSPKPTQTECAALDTMISYVEGALKAPGRGNGARMAEIAASLKSSEAKALAERACGIVNEAAAFDGDVDKITDCQFAVARAGAAWERSKGPFGGHGATQRSKEEQEAINILEQKKKELAEAYQPFKDFRDKKAKEVEALRADHRKLVAKAGK